MGFHNLITHSIDNILHELPADPTVCELGNQTLKNAKQRRTIYKRLKIKGVEPETVKQWYQSVGFSNYVAIDVNDEKDAIEMDLNLDLQSSYNYYDTFDLVTNNGTGEHCFNQYSVFSNVHNLTKTKGYMIHALPFYRWVDHGFYNYNPNLFICLAKANQYKIVKIMIGQNDAERLETIDHTRLDRYDGYRKDFDLDSWPKDPTVVAILQKTNDLDFVMPMQHLYDGDNITSQEIKDRYS